MPTTRLVIADDHDVVRTGIRGVLERQPGFEVVGEASNGRDAVELALRLRPDVVVLDLSMPDLNGLEATRQILAQGTGTRVLILSMHSSRQFIGEVLKAGASGYLLKNTAVTELPIAVTTVAAGRVYLSPSIADVVVEDYVRHVPSIGHVASNVLSPREREVLQLLAEGKTSKEIAALLLVSVKTVDASRATIMDKLDIRSVAELTKFAVREGLTPLE